MNLAPTQLDPGVYRVAVSFGQPKQPIAAAMVFLAVGEVEELSRRSRGVQPEQARSREPRGSIEIQICIERRRQAVEKVDRILRGVVPIAGPLHPAAIGTVFMKTR